MVLLIFGAIVFYLWPKASCSDGRQNQGELGIDCGGSCIPCVVNVEEAVVLWARVFPTKTQSASGGEIYDVAALINNPNISYGLSLLKYTFKIYDANNILVGIKEGKTFLNPNDKFLIFETGIDAGKRKAIKAFVELEPISSWKYIKEEKSSLVISEKSFSNIQFPSLTGKIFNQAISPVRDIYAAAVLFDKDENAIGVSTTKVDIIAAESGYNVVFTWPQDVNLSPASSAIFTRIDQTKQKN